MELRRASFALTLTASLALAAPASASHQYRDTARCASQTVRSVKIIASSSEALAFRKSKRVSGRTEYVSYACMRRGAGAVERLKGSEFTRSRIQPKLAGRYVAFRRLDELNEFAAVAGIVVLDMRTGTIVYESPEDDAYTGDWAVKRNGSVAWIDVLQNEPYGSRVWKVDSTTAGQRQELDSGLTIEDFRLSADRRQVLWTKNGAPQSAPID